MKRVQMKWPSASEAGAFSAACKRRRGNLPQLRPNLVGAQSRQLEQAHCHCGRHSRTMLDQGDTEQSREPAYSSRRSVDAIVTSASDAVMPGEIPAEMGWNIEGGDSYDKERRDSERQTM